MRLKSVEHDKQLVFTLQEKTVDAYNPQIVVFRL